MAELSEYVTNHPYLAVGLLAALFAVAFYELRRLSQGQTNVSANDTVRLINGGAVVIDVRRPEEYQAGHIVNARNVALADVSADQGLLKKQKNKVLITVCDNGIASNKAASLLRKSGYDKAFSLKGGLNCWRAENLPLVK